MRPFLQDGTSSPRKRTGWRAEDDEDGSRNDKATMDELNSGIILDETEQTEIIQQLQTLNDQSSTIWRVATLILNGSAFLVYALSTLPPSPLSAKANTLTSILFSSRLILIELLCSSLASISDFVTSLPTTPPTPASPLRSTPPSWPGTPYSASAITPVTSTSPPRAASLFTRERLAQLLQLPPELASPTTRARLRLSKPLLAALCTSGLRTLVGLVSVALRHRARAKGTISDTFLPVEDAALYTGVFVVLLVTLLAQSYAEEMDRDLAELERLQYASKGA